MNAHPYSAAIEALKQQISDKEAALHAELFPLKTTVNQLCKLAGEPEVYVIDGPTAGSSSGKKTLKFKEDQFFNKPLASSVGTYLEARETLGMERPASIDEIYEGLISGGFKFEGATGSEENQKRALKIALTKNTAQFVKIGEKFGLKKWYGMRAPRKPNGGTASAPEADAGVKETDSDTNTDALVETPDTKTTPSDLNN